MALQDWLTQGDTPTGMLEYSFFINYIMRGEFYKKTNKMFLSVLQPKTYVHDQPSPPSEKMIYSGKEASSSFVSELDLDLSRSFLAEEDADEKMMSINLVEGESFSRFMSTDKSEVSFRSQLHVHRRRTQGYLSVHKRQSLPLITFKQKTDLKLSPQRFKPEFISSVQNCIYSNSTMQKLLKALGDLPLTHPFTQTCPGDIKSGDSCETIMDLWIFRLSEYKKMILSFDFLFSHCGFVLSLLFYYAQLTQRPVNPLLSFSQEMEIERREVDAKRNILKIMFEYIWYRTRDIKNDTLVLKLLDQFFQHLKRETLDDGFTLEYSERLHDLLYGFLKYESQISSKLDDGKECAQEHLQQICINYEQKDKFIKDDAQDIADLFNQIVKRGSVNSTLSFYYQTNQFQGYKKNVANRYTLITCWLLQILIGKCRTNGYLALEYLKRYFYICRHFMSKNNLQSLLLFTSIILIVKQYLPNLWGKFIEKRKVVQAELQLEKFAKYPNSVKFMIPKEQKCVIYFEEVRILHIIQSLRERWKDKGLINLTFHEDIQECARRILFYRKQAQNEIMNDNRYNKTIKVNINYRFMSFYIYEILNKRIKSPEEEFDRIKRAMEQADTQIAYPFFGF